VRGNTASNIQIDGNSISEAGEVAIYSEFGFEGAIIANNSARWRRHRVSVTNFNEGGRLAVGARQHHPESDAATVRPAPIRTTPPVSASRSRPIPRSPAT